jgi:hypothetical protein
MNDTHHRRRSPLFQWLLAEESQSSSAHHVPHPWWQVMCLTGVDYFSTLGYQPGIAALAAGTLSPIATAILILLTLFGALPIYRRVAATSPNGEGSIAMLAKLLDWWQGKLLVLVLLGFVGTDFIITITLSAADAAMHLVENPYLQTSLHGQQLTITLILIALLGAVFLKGFKEAVGIAVVLVIAYLGLNAIVVGVGISQVIANPITITDWQTAIFREHGNPLNMLAVSALLFPKLALGLSGFETGVAVMPLVAGDAQDTHEQPRGRIRNTGTLLASAALIMSAFLISTSFITTLLISADKFKAGGVANGRALSYLAHTYLGSGFGTVYDVSTILILWFAGASAMAGLLNIVPRYLPRYGMAPMWARMNRPLVLVFTTIAFIVTIIFQANVEAQGGAYATGVLVLMTSAAFAVTLASRRSRNRYAPWIFGLITLVFAYTTTVNVIERPDGIRIASFFIGTIIIVSLLSRVNRATELRSNEVILDDRAQQFIDDFNSGIVRIIANDLDAGDIAEYQEKEQAIREDNLLPADQKIVFLEVEVTDASEFEDKLEVQGLEVGGYRILRIYSSAVPNAIASCLLYLRDTMGKPPHIYFSWGEENPLIFMFRFIVFGEGDIPVTTREILRKAEPDPHKRPRVHVGSHH